MNIARKAAWLCRGAMALVPHISIGSTSQTRFVIGATVVAPCRVGTQAGQPWSCANDSQSAALTTREGSEINRSTGKTKLE
jgi:hypothetical protein